MATPLDLGLLEHVGVIFPFLFVFIIVYAVLLRVEFFKDNKGLTSLLALVCAVMTLFSPIVSHTVAMMAPWFVLFFLFIVFMLIAFMIFGVSLADITKVVKGDGSGKAIVYWILAIVLVIVIGSLTSVVSQYGGVGNVGAGDAIDVDSVPAGSNQESEFWNTLVDPKVLGLALVLMIASFTVRFMTAAN